MGVSYSTPKSATRQPEDQTNQNSGSGPHTCDSRLLNFSKINGKNSGHTNTPVQLNRNLHSTHRSESNPLRNDSAVQALSASPLLSSGSNSYLDPMLYVNINSPGFVSRVVDSADQSAISSASAQSRYNGVGLFPRVQLRSPSPLPILSPKHSQKFGKGTVHVRIAPPSSASQYERKRSNSFGDPDESYKSVLESLQEKSRKRIYSQCQEAEDYNMKKKQRKGEGSLSEGFGDGQQYRLRRSSSVGSSNAVLQIIDPVLQAKRAREEEYPTESLKRQKKRVVTYNNEILSSLSSSRALLQRLTANKRKTADLDGSSTSALQKQFKENVDISSPKSPPRWVQQSKPVRENGVSVKSPTIKSPEVEKRTAVRDSEAIVNLLDREEAPITPETLTPKSVKKCEDVDLNLKLFRKKGAVKAKARVATSSPWKHAAPVADEVSCSLHESVDETLDRPQRLRGLLARMRGEGAASSTSPSEVLQQPSKLGLSFPSFASASTPTSRSTDKKSGGTLSSISIPSSPATSSVSSVPSTSSAVSISVTTGSSTSISTFSTPALSSGTSTAASSPKSGFGAFSVSSTINTRSVSSSLFGSQQSPAQTSPVAITHTTLSGLRPVSSPTRDPTTDKSSVAAATTATPTATQSLPTFGSSPSSSTAVSATISSPAPVSTAAPSISTFAFSGSPQTTSTVKFGAGNPSLPSSSSVTPSLLGVSVAATATSTATIASTPAATPVISPAAAPASAPTSTPASVPNFNFSAGKDAAKPALPTFQFGASNPALSAPAATSTLAGQPATSSVTFNLSAATAPTSSTSSNLLSVKPSFGTMEPKTVVAAPSSSTSAPLFSFGAPAASTATSKEAATSSATSSAPSAGMFSFSSTANAKTEGGAPAVQFGNTAVPKTTPFAFGASSAHTAPKASTAATSATLSFGAPAPSQAPPPTFGGLGAATTQSQTPGVFPFGSSSNSAPVFGGSASGATPASSAPAFGTAFGAATTTAVPTFGTSATPTFAASSSAAFGASPAPTFGAAPAPAFGAVTTTSAPMFGAGSTPTMSFGAASTPAFGSTATTSASPMFGGASAASPFGAPAPTSNPTFGSSGSTSATFGSTSGTFGGSQPNAAAPAFGAPTSAFGSPQTAPIFGSASAQPVTPAFGASSSAVPSFGSSTPAPAFGATPNSSGTAPAFQFGAPSATQPAFNLNPGPAQSVPGTSQGFNFSAAPATPAFQFGGAGPSPSPAPGLLFGAPDGSANAAGAQLFGSPGAPVPLGAQVPLGTFPMGAGMFHIGSGSSNTSQRPRQTARRRK